LKRQSLSFAAIFEGREMKTALACVVFSALPAILTFSARAQSPNCSLTIHVDGFRNQKGDLGVTLFTSPDGWPEHNDRAYRHGAFPFSNDKATVKLELPPGRYGIAVLHDENSNHKLDRNFFGIPKEGFGFSKNPKVRLTAPSFDATAIEVACPTTETLIHLDYK
jgi:uncharacterized protein (DUF2141 family)